MEKKLKIVHLTAQQHLAGGGIRTQLKTLLYCLDNEQTENIILTNESDESDRKEFQDLGVSVFSRLSSSPSGPSNPLAIIQWMTKMLKQLQPDIATTYSFQGNMLGRQAAFGAGVPVIIAREDNTILNLNEKHLGIKRHLAKITDRIVCNAEAVKKYVYEVERITLDNMEVIYYGIVIEKYKFNYNYAPQKPFEFVYVGRLDPQKNPLLMFDSFAQLVVDYPDVRLSVIGDGSLKEECMNRVNKLGLSKYVSFLGYKQKPWDWVKPGSASIVTSLYEGLPNTVLEAMASGIIAIVPNLPVMNEIAKNGSELIIYEQGDKDKLVSAMKLVLEMTPAEKRSRIKAARTRVEQDFDAYKMTNKYLNLCQNIYQKKVLKLKPSL